MSCIIDGSAGITTPGVVNTAGETIATTLSVTGVTTLTGGLNAALPVLSGGTGVTTSTGSGAVVLGTSPTLTTPTFDSASLVTISGTAPLYMCRAWVNFNGTGTVAIRASGNVSSITDGGTGTYTVNFTTAIVDANYAAASLVTPYIAGNDYRYFTFVKTQTTSNVAMQCNQVMNGVSATDAELVAVAIFR